MSRSADRQWLQALCAAWETSQVYSTEHASYQKAVTRCAEMLEQLTNEGATVTLAVCDDGIILGNALITDRLLTGAAFIARLTVRGVSLVRIKAGVSAADVQWLLESDEAIPGAASPSGSIRLGRLDSATARRMLSAARPPAKQEDEAVGGWNPADPAETVMPLKTAWTSLLAGEQTIPSAVGRLAANITSAVLNMRSDLLPLLDLKDHDEYTFVHAVNVGLIASALGQAVGLPQHKLQQLTEAALLHDIGKRMVPLSILNKKGPLDESELAVMRTHPVLGAALLSSVRGVTDVCVVVAYEHHLRIDGGGYPLVARRRPPALVSQLVMVADIFDALRSDRPYRHGCETEEVLEIMSRDSGSAFDRELFEVLRTGVARCITTPAPGSAAAPGSTPASGSGSIASERPAQSEAA